MIQQIKILFLLQALLIASFGNAANCIFGAASNFPVGEPPFSVISADFDSDQKLDLAVANLTSDNISILPGNGDGSFGAAANFTVGDGPRSLVSADFNEDGTLDLAVANFFF